MLIISWQEYLGSPCCAKAFLDWLPTIWYNQLFWQAQIYLCNLSGTSGFVLHFIYHVSHHFQSGIALASYSVSELAGTTLGQNTECLLMTKPTLPSWTWNLMPLFHLDFFTWRTRKCSLTNQFGSVTKVGTCDLTSVTILDFN